MDNPCIVFGDVKELGPWKNPIVKFTLHSKSNILEIRSVTMSVSILKKFNRDTSKSTLSGREEKFY
jgi:hypothetical protein